MMTSRVRWMLLGTVGFVAVSLISAAAFAKDELPKAVRVLREVLSEESHLHNLEWDRRQQFREELTNARNSDELRWHCGYIKIDDGWKAVEALGGQTSQRGRFDEYLKRRQSTNRDYEDQWKLAIWRYRAGLPEQGEAHLFQSFLLSPPSLDISERLKRLRYRRIDEKLVSPFEFAELEHEAEARTRDFNQWLPKVKRLTASIKKEPEKSVGRSLRMKDISQHAAVPAIEQILASANEVQSKVLIDTLGQTQSYRASQTLARVAMLSPTLQIRDWAIEALQTRKKDDYVPGLIGLLRSPVAQQVQTDIGPRGEKDLRVVLKAEDSTTIHVLDLRVLDYTTMNRWTNITSFNSPEIRGLHQIDNSPAELAKAHEVRTALIRLDAWADIANLETETTSDRVNSILRITCDSPNLSTPHDWWSWWANFDDVDVSPKRVVIVKEEQRLGRYVPPTMRVSCLVAGTPVWTERGLMPIEQVQIGDRVLSKDVETGELALKPVLHTTYRPPRKTIRFELGSDFLQATGGHRFWVSGSGWLRTRELDVNQPLHTTTGITRITAVQSAEEAPTYNLVVADFHTYFVGKSGILSHDVLPPKPTNKLVPGLSE